MIKQKDFGYCSGGCLPRHTDRIRLIYKRKTNIISVQENTLMKSTLVLKVMGPGGQGSSKCQKNRKKGPSAKQAESFMSHTHAAQIEACYTY